MSASVNNVCRGEQLSNALVYQQKCDRVYLLTAAHHHLSRDFSQQLQIHTTLWLCNKCPPNSTYAQFLHKTCFFWKISFKRGNGSTYFSQLLKVSYSNFPLSFWADSVDNLTIEKYMKFTEESEAIELEVWAQSMGWGEEGKKEERRKEKRDEGEN